jgi:hypothetical protein
MGRNGNNGYTVPLQRATKSNMTHSPRVAEAVAYGLKKRKTPTRGAAKACSSHAECFTDEEESPEDGSYSQQHSAREIKSKVSDFTRFVDGLAAENAANKKELHASQHRNQVLTDKQSALLKEIKDHELSNDRLREIITDQESSIQDIRTDNEHLQKKVDDFADESDELTKLRSMVAVAKSHLKDYITLESTGSSLITTTGQVRLISIIHCV